MKIAMISYNPFVRGEEDYWKGGWKQSQGPNGGECYAWHDRAFLTLTREGREALRTADKAVIYLGEESAAAFLELIIECGVDPKKAIFVLCDCGLEEKISGLHEHGYSSSKMIPCECGGRKTMAHLYDEFIETGDISAADQKGIPAMAAKETNKGGLNIAHIMWADGYEEFLIIPEASVRSVEEELDGSGYEVSAATSVVIYPVIAGPDEVLHLLMHLDHMSTGAINITELLLDVFKAGRESTQR